MTPQSIFHFFLSCALFTFVLPLQAHYKPENRKLENERTSLTEQTPLPPGKNYVTVCQEGNQLGGQLTTFAVVLGYAWTHGLNPVFEKNMLLNLPGGRLNYEYIFHRLAQELPLDVDSSAPLHYFCHHYQPYPEILHLPYKGGNACLCAAPPHPLPMFQPFRSKIRQVFGPSEEIVTALREKYSDVMDHPKTVAVHIRAYDPRTVPHQCLGKEYYEKAINYFTNDHLFVVFSDRIGWCKDHLDFSGKNVVYIEGNTHVFDLYLMSFCKNIIIANSTFSWWAAYLKHDSEGLILAPHKWFPNENPAYRLTFYPPHYTVIPMETFPTKDWDLLDYPTTSKGDI